MRVILLWLIKWLTNLLDQRDSAITPGPGPDPEPPPYVPYIPGDMAVPEQPVEEPTTPPLRFGMWSVNGSSFGELERSWPEISGGCDMIHSNGGAVVWGPSTGHRRDPIAEGLAYASLMERVHDFNLSHGRSVTHTLFRNLWALTRYRTDPWALGDIQTMLDTFVTNLNAAHLTHVNGVMLGDDFDGHGYTDGWDDIVRSVAHRMPGTRIIFTQDILTHVDGDRGFLGHGAAGHRDKFPGLAKWLHVLNDVDAVPVLVPQFYPYAAGKVGKLEFWFTELLDGLLWLRDHRFERLVVEPIIQACAYKHQTVTQARLQRQTKVAQEHPLVDALWLLAWNPRGAREDYAWALNMEGNHWTANERLLDAVLEAKGETDVME